MTAEAETRKPTDRESSAERGHPSTGATRR
jgi:hypothetical protein